MIRPPRSHLRLLPHLLALLLGSLLTTTALGGEDFPFSCAAEDRTVSFHVKTDRRSPTGAVLILHRRLRIDLAIPVELTSTVDGKYWVVKGRHTASTGRVRQVLAYIGMGAGLASHGDVQEAWRDQERPDWDLKPLACRRL